MLRIVEENSPARNGGDGVMVTVSISDSKKSLPRTPADLTALYDLDCTRVHMYSWITALECTPYG